MTTTARPPFPRAWKGTRDTLHAYVQAIGALARNHAPAEPFWGHRGLRLDGARLVTAPVPLSSGGQAVAGLDLAEPAATLTIGSEETRWRLTETGPAGVAAGIQRLVVSHGLTIDTPERLPEAPLGEDLLSGAPAFGAILTSASRVIAGASGRLSGWATPQRFWPHGFDLSLVWFGGEHPPQAAAAENAPRITIGFDPTTEPYFYVNPWPFRGDYTDCTLPDGASWHTRGWRGTLLPYPEGSHERVGELVAAIHGVAGG